MGVGGNTLDRLGLVDHEIVETARKTLCPLLCGCWGKSKLASSGVRGHTLLDTIIREGRGPMSSSNGFPVTMHTPPRDPAMSTPAIKTSISFPSAKRYLHTRKPSPSDSRDHSAKSFLSTRLRHSRCQVYKIVFQQFGETMGASCHRDLRRLCISLIYTALSSKFLQVSYRVECSLRTLLHSYTYTYRRLGY